MSGKRAVGPEACVWLSAGKRAWRLDTTSGRILESQRMPLPRPRLAGLGYRMNGRVLAVYRGRPDGKLRLQYGAWTTPIVPALSAEHAFVRGGFCSRLVLRRDDEVLMTIEGWIVRRRVLRSLDRSYLESGRSKTDGLLGVSFYVNSADARVAAFSWDPYGTPDDT